MEMQVIEEAIRRDDFAVGDSFWIGDWELEVVSRKKPGALFDGGESIFRWELTREEFVHAIMESHPEIENPEAFFDEHEDTILHDFAKAFDVLVGECGATYGTIIGDVVDEVVAQQAKPRGCEK